LRQLRRGGAADIAWTPTTVTRWWLLVCYSGASLGPEGPSENGANFGVLLAQGCNVPRATTLALGAGLLLWQLGLSPGLFVFSALEVVQTVCYISQLSVVLLRRWWQRYCSDWFGAACLTLPVYEVRSPLEFLCWIGGLVSGYLYSIAGWRELCFRERFWFRWWVESPYAHPVIGGACVEECGAMAANLGHWL